MARKNINGTVERFRAAMALPDRLYTISNEEPLLPSINSSDAGREPMPRPDLGIASLRPAACAVIEDYFRVSPASLAAELAAGHYLTPDEHADPPLVITSTACSG